MIGLVFSHQVFMCFDLNTVTVLSFWPRLGDIHVLIEPSVCWLMRTERKRTQPAAHVFGPSVLRIRTR